MGNIYGKKKKLPELESPAVALKQIMIEQVADCDFCGKKNVNGYLIQSIIEERKTFICDECSGTKRY